MPERSPSIPQSVRPPVLAARYELLRTQGTTRNTASILAWDTRLKRWRQIQIARPGDESAAEKLIVMAQQAARLEHPTLERVIDVGQDGPIAFVVRDRFIGSVSTQLARRGALAPEWAVEVATRCAEGLAWAHDRGIVHGHPRPEVVRFAEEGEPVLTDFGQRAKLRDNSETRAGAPWAHLAPELRQFWEPDTSTDIFALGALLYTMLAGRHAADLFYAEAYEGLLAPIPRHLRPIVIQACAYNPRERFQSAAEFHEALISRVKTLPGAKGDPPWLEITQDLPERGEIYEIDAILEEIGGALGPRPLTARADLIDDQLRDSTFDSENMDLQEPSLASQVPRGLSPGPLIPSDAPTALNQARPPAPPSGTPISAPPRNPIVVPSYSEPAPSFAPARRLVTVHQDGTRGIGSRQRRYPLFKHALRLAGLAIVASTALVAALGAAILFYSTLGPRADRALVDAVLAEQAAVNAIVVDDKELQEIWQRFDEAKDEDRARRAADFVRAIEVRAEAAPLPVELEKAVHRLSQAEEDWVNGFL
ncbi:MAG TPA: hypothetical protein ENK18_21680 [Deltaproteobacteria bacterium]|nr:hypothetical protein [Deltaproteobacteria bacterium]